MGKKIWYIHFKSVTSLSGFEVWFLAIFLLLLRTTSMPKLFVPCSDMTEVMISSTPMEDIRLSPGKDRLSYQIFPDPSDFDRCCKLKDRLPSIVVEPTEGEVESGELRWPPEEFLWEEYENCLKKNIQKMQCTDP
uniref:Protein LBH n=1 Tax=Periophthalmus magnuspinnatus TaxID=409849 RepID=A0A3B4AF15_9GOBI